MTKKYLQRDYIKEFSYPKFNKYNNNDYTKWLETKLIETEKQCNIHDVSDSYSWLKKGITAYTFGAILRLVEIEILEVDFENKIANVKTEFQEGKLDFDRIYKTASDCDFR